MKLRCQFITMEVDDHIAAVPVGDTGFNGMLKLNDVAADILDQLKEETTPQQVHLHLKEKYPDSTDQEIGENLAEFLNTLLREGLLLMS